MREPPIRTYLIKTPDLERALASVMLLSVLAAFGSTREGLLAPFGSASVRQLLEPLSLPLSQGSAANAQPKLLFHSNVSPRLQVRRRSNFLDGAHVGVTLDLSGAATLDAAACEPWLNGIVSITRERCEWRKLWMFPGLLDAAMHIELCSAIDLRSGRHRGDMKLGLRGVRRTEVGLVHRVPLGTRQLGPCSCSCGVNVGVMLMVPNELRISLGDTDGLLRDARFEAHFNQLDLVIEVDAAEQVHVRSKNADPNDEPNRAGPRRVSSVTR